MTTMTTKEEHEERRRLRREVTAADESLKAAKRRLVQAKKNLTEFEARRGPRCAVVAISVLDRLKTWRAREVIEAVDKERYDTE